MCSDNGVMPFQVMLSPDVTTISLHAIQLSVNYCCPRLSLFLHNHICKLISIMELLCFQITQAPSRMKNCGSLPSLLSNMAKVTRILLALSHRMFVGYDKICITHHELQHILILQPMDLLMWSGATTTTKHDFVLFVGWLTTPEPKMGRRFRG